MQDTPDIADRHDAICVIGAGAGGLAAIKNLREHGFAVDCYERETSVGGAWNWRHDRSPMYASTHLISSRPLTEFPDFPMPDAWPDYPHHTQVLSYLEHYAEHFGLGEHIWFGTEVVAAVPVGDGRWDVTTRSTGGGAERVQRYAGLVVANGHNWDPAKPEIPGEFRGQVIHSAAYKDTAQLRNRKVLVIGGGNTGCDIAVEAAQQATTVWHSTRRGYWYAPKYLFGRPADQVNDRLLRLRLPLPVRQWLYRRTVGLTVGDLTRFGLPAPDHKPYETHPIVNSQLPFYLAHGRITPVPDVARFDGAAVELADGRRVEPDLVITATGYRARFEFLAPEIVDTDADGRPDLHLHAFARKHPTLAVVGLLQGDAGVFPLAHWQSVAIARWLRLRTTDPVRAAAVQQKESARPVRGWSRTQVVHTRRHWFEVDHVDYLRSVEGLLREMETHPTAPPATQKWTKGSATLLRFDDWTDPVRPVKRDVISKLPEDAGENPPVLFVAGPGHGAAAFAEHWLPHTAARGFAAYALTPRDGGKLREHVHDVVQTAASLPRQVVLVGHGEGALVVAHALGRYPARAAVLAAPVLDRWATLGTALRVNPLGAVPAVFGGRLRLSRRQLFSPALPVERAEAYGRSSRMVKSRKPVPTPVGDPPALVIGSPDDQVVPRKSLDRTAARLGGAPLLFPGMGHDLMLDAAWTEPIEAILDWLTKELSTAG